MPSPGFSNVCIGVCVHWFVMESTAIGLLEQGASCWLPAERTGKQPRSFTEPEKRQRERKREREREARWTLFSVRAVAVCSQERRKREREARRRKRLAVAGYSLLPSHPCIHTAYSSFTQLFLTALLRHCLP